MSDPDLRNHDPADLLWTWHYDFRDGPGPEVFWHPHPVVKRTKRYLIVADHSVLHRRFSKPSRPAHFYINRATIEAEGQVFSPTATHNFFTSACKDAEQRKQREQLQAERMASFAEDMATGMRVLELGPKLDFAEVAPGILKAAGFDVYVADGRIELCEARGAPSQPARSECQQCSGTGGCLAVHNFRAREGISRFTMCPGKDLDHVREMIAGGIFPPGCAAFVCLKFPPPVAGGPGVEVALERTKSSPGNKAGPGFAASAPSGRPTAGFRSAA